MNNSTENKDLKIDTVERKEDLKIDTVEEKEENIIDEHFLFLSNGEEENYINDELKSVRFLEKKEIINSTTDTNKFDIIVSLIYDRLLIFSIVFFIIIIISVSILVYYLSI